jgi:octaprenyl-diphosphate synthase
MNELSHVTSKKICSGALPRVFELLGDDLAAVEVMLAGQVSGSIESINEMVRQGCLAGGKRFRPILLLLSARALGEVTSRHVTIATAIEMIHAATLVHDDIIDNASTRRHVPTINSRWGNHTAVLFGDFLFSHAFYLASTTGDATACQIIGKATNQVCEGEMQQGEAAGNYALDIEDYFEIIGKKTATLCGCATHLGARFSGGSETVCMEWERVGHNLGLAFQIVDDVLDIRGDQNACGKTLGTDLATATPTLPILIALSRESSTGYLNWLEQLGRQGLGHPLRCPGGGLATRGRTGRRGIDDYFEIRQRIRQRL